MINLINLNSMDNNIEFPNIYMYERFKDMCHQLYDNYDPLASYGTDSDQKVFLGDKNTRVCRFCGRTKPDVNFRKDAHALSNLIGNNRLFSYYECDECNGVLFTQFESHFANYMRLKHCLAQVRGKNGIPTFKPKNDSFSRIDVDNVISIVTKEDEDSFCEVDEVNKTIHFHGKRTYIPQMVYKCLLKMALTVIPESELCNVQNAMDFLMGRKLYKTCCYVVYRQFGGAGSLGKPICHLYKRKDNPKNPSVPLYLFSLAYSYFHFVLPIPFCDADGHLQGNSMTIVPIPTPLDIDSIPAVEEHLTLSSDERVVKEEYSMDFTFGSMVENPIYGEENEE